jgi:hypothetical protein
MTDLRTAAQQFVTDYENGDLGDLKHYARALRAALEQPKPPPEAQTEAERLAYCAGWWAAMEQKREQPAQEPVAWRWRMRNPTDSPGFAQPWNVTTYYPREQANEIEPLYTHPPRREWQELTREGINKMMAAVGWQNAAIRQADLDKVEKVVRAIEAALRSKNHE